MACTKQTTRIDSNSDGSIMVPMGDLDFDEQSYSELASAAKTSPSDPSGNLLSEESSEEGTLDSTSSKKTAIENVDGEMESKVLSEG